MLNDRSSAFALLSTRRSLKPKELSGPAPDAAALEQILRVGARVPDHGKLAPWRFVVVPQAARGAFADLLERAYRAEQGAAEDADLRKIREFAHPELALITVLSAPQAGHKIPVWEQELSAGAACLNLLHTATALGFAGAWLTGWAAYSPGVARALGAAGHERIAGFVFIGTPAAEPAERERPAVERVALMWNP
jgi:nitroreductase